GIEGGRPTHRYGGGTDRVFEYQRPTDNPCDQLAKRRVRVRVRTAGDGDHGGKFAVTDAGEGAAEGRQQEGIHHGRTGMGGGGHSGEGENTGPDNSPDSQRDQRFSPQASLQW